MTQKPVVWQFTSKDIVVACGFIATILFHYYSLVSKIDVYQAENKGEHSIFEYRISKLEKQDDTKVAYYIPKDAIIPQTPRVKRIGSIDDLN